MKQLIINTLSGLVPPYSGIVCDVYMNNCVSIGEIPPIPATITLPSQFDSAPAIGFRIISDGGCDKFVILNCDDDENYRKRFQSGEEFYFMDSEIYFFQ